MVRESLILARVRDGLRCALPGKCRSTGTVFAEDINPQAIQYIDQRCQKEKLTNVHTVLGTPDDPKLPQESVDVVLMLKVYHEIAHPAVLLANLKPALKSGAKIGIIDRNGNGTDHGLNSDIVKREMGEAGFKLVASYDFTKGRTEQDYFLIFHKSEVRCALFPRAGLWTDFPQLPKGSQFVAPEMNASPL